MPNKIFHLRQCAFKNRATNVNCLCTNFPSMPLATHDSHGQILAGARELFLHTYPYLLQGTCIVRCEITSLPVWLLPEQPFCGSRTHELNTTAACHSSSFSTAAEFGSSQGRGWMFTLWVLGPCQIGGSGNSSSDKLVSSQFTVHVPCNWRASGPSHSGSWLVPPKRSVVYSHVWLLLLPRLNIAPQLLVSIFARRGVPEEICTKNGPQLSSSKGCLFTVSSRNYYFNPTTSSLPFPQDIVLTEVALKTIKAH